MVLRWRTKRAPLWFELRGVRFHRDQAPRHRRRQIS